MTDPWADLKRRYMQPLYPVPWLQAIRDVERMTTDADALLMVVRAAQEWSDLRGKPIYHSELEINKTLAALPEHLRGDTDERSRKA